MDPRLRYEKSTAPEGISGAWAVERFSIRQPDRDVAAIDERPPWARPRPGRYTRLRRGSVDYMTDLYEEWWSQLPAMEEAARRGGDVLVTGLGLGMVADTLLRCEPFAVESVTVLEASSEVIALVAPSLESRHGSRIRVLHADAFEWTPPEGTRYSVAWHDIWPTPFDPRSVSESRELMDRYATHADWQGSWALVYRELAGVAAELEGASA